MVEWYLFLPQVRLPVADIVERARQAEASGFDGIAFIDHLEAPGLARRKHLGGNGDRHVGGGQDASGCGSAIWCCATRSGIRRCSPSKPSRCRKPRTADSISASVRDPGRPSSPDSMSVSRIRSPASSSSAATWRCSGSTGADGDDDVGPGSVSPAGTIRYRWFWVAADRRMMELVRKYADWWNLQANHLDRLPRLAPAAGSARVSVQQMVGFVRSGGDPDTVREVSTRRFGNLGSGLVCGDADELIAALRGSGRPGGRAVLRVVRRFRRARTRCTSSANR